MFLETILFTESASPFMGAMNGSTPKGVSNHRSVLSFYKHFTATRFFSTSPSDEKPFIS